MKRVFLLASVLIYFTSCKCHTNLDFATDSIESLTMDFNPEVKFRTQLRMAFGKTLSKAFINPEVLGYILEESKSVDKNSFNELLLGVHVDKEVYNGKSLREYLNDAMDDEVKSLFDDNLIDTLLAFDPLISIKIPDIFSGEKWINDNLLPFVYVQTPIHLRDYDKYMAYHGSGYQELISNDINPPYFCTVVKYSEDFLLLSRNAPLNEKGISLYEFFPQIRESDWNEIKNSVFKNALEAPRVPGYYYVSKKFIFNAANEYKYEEYRLVEDDPSCDMMCERDCKSIDDLKTVIKGFSLKNGYPFDERDKSRMFLESYSLNFIIHYGKDGDKIESRVGLHGNRITELVGEVIGEYKLKPEKRCYEKIGEVVLPTLVGSKGYDFSGSNFVIENVPIIDGWLEGERQKSYSISAYYSEYLDIVNPRSYTYQGQASIKLNATFFVQIGKRVLYYCDETNHRYNFGNSEVTVSY